MRSYLLSLSLLATVAVSLSTSLEPWFQNWQGNRTKSANALQVALGDGRRLFANHFFFKADAYFHNGYYPSIYDRRPESEKAHMVEAMQQPDGEHEEENGYLGEPKDWLDRFSRNLFPSRHAHLGGAAGEASAKNGLERGEGRGEHVHGEHCNHDHDEESPTPAGGEQEILPWLRLSAELDPERVQTYVLASYWLRTKLGKDKEAEQFLREGLNANPGDCEILLELGRIYYEHRKDVSRACNVLELAYKNWRQREAGKPEPDLFLGVQILNLLAMLERERNNPARAIEHYTALLEFTSHKDVIQSWIDLLRTNAPAATTVAPR